MDMTNESRLYAAGAYVLLIFSGVMVLLIRKNGKYAKFHAMQSILLTIGMMILTLLLALAGNVLDRMPFFGWVAGVALLIAVGLMKIGLLALWLWLIWEAYIGEEWLVPLIGAQAKKMAEKA
jgi:uncharacterized membrane protein